ncbi:hypothetical protein GLV89_01840 [Halomonas alkaliantarctica]|nr:hypothetical protein [Halomonas alkaliantarctica]
MKTLTLFVLLVLLTSCAGVTTPLDDGYEVGDVSRTVYGGAAHLAALRAAYCQSGDPLVRQAMLLSIRAIASHYPEEGLCTDLVDLHRQATQEQR